MAPLGGLLGIGAGPIAHDDLARWSLSHVARVSAVRSGSRSTRRPRSRSQRIVPSRWPCAKPSHQRRDTRRERPLQTASRMRRNRVVAPTHAGPGGQTRSRIAAQRQSDGVM